MIPAPPAQAIKVQDIAAKLAWDHAGASDAGGPTVSFMRKIQHDVAKLRAVFADLQVEETADGAHWICWRKAPPRLTSQGMTIEQKVAFGVLEMTGIDLLPRTSMKALKPYFDEARLDGTRWTRKIAVQPGTVRFEPPRIRPEVESTVYAALLEDASIRIDYRGANGKVSRDVLLRPLALVRRDVRTYLVARGMRDERPRNYALHRILNASDTVADVPKQPGFSLDEHLQSGIAHPIFQDENIRYGSDISLRLWVNKGTGWIQETPLSKDQKVETLADGNFDLRATVPLTEELVRWILSMAYHVRVIEPPFLVRRICEDARRMSELYREEAGAPGA